MAEPSEHSMSHQCVRRGFFVLHLMMEWLGSCEHGANPQKVSKQYHCNAYTEACSGDKAVSVVGEEVAFNAEFKQSKGVSKDVLFTLVEEETVPVERAWMETEHEEVLTHVSDWNRSEIDLQLVGDEVVHEIYEVGITVHVWDQEADKESE